MVNCSRRSYFNSLGANYGVDFCKQSLDFLVHVEPEVFAGERQVRRKELANIYRADKYSLFDQHFPFTDNLKVTCQANVFTGTTKHDKHLPGLKCKI